MLGGTANALISRVISMRPPVSRRMPVSINIDTSCSTKRGLPSAADRMRSLAAAGSSTPARRLSRTIAAASPGRPSRTTRTAEGPSLHVGLSSSMSGRAVQTIMTDALPRRSTRCSMSSRRAGAAQCTSSMTTVTGPWPAMRSSSALTPQKSSAIGSCSSVQPTADPTRRAISMSSASASSCRIASSGAASGPTPAASRTISRSGQNVMPSPYGRQRPRRIVARCSRSASSSRTRRLFPTPASPRTVASMHRRSEVDRSSTANEGAELLLAADERRVVQATGLLVADDAEQPVRDHHLGLSLEVQRRHRLGLDRATHETEGGLPDEDLVFSGGLLEPGGGVERVAREDLLVVDRRADHDVAGVDADPDLSA